ncbi:MAG: flippase-like domain-containing protein [Alphaproteobacteria bacterium]|nr:flippase-like domain-containing protein [Alphaproteobacteria bacterium]
MLKSWLIWGAKLGFSGVLIWYLIGKVDLDEAWRRGSAIQADWLAVSVGLMLAQIALATWRWHSVMRAIDAVLDFRQTLRILYMGTFFNLALPSSIGGDALRVWKARRAGLTLPAALNSVMLERVATLFGLVLLVAVTQPLLLSRLDDVPGAWVFPILTLMGLAGIGVLMVLDQLPEGFRRWRVMRGLAQLAGDTRRLFLTPRHAVITLGLAVLGHANLALVVYALAVGLGIEVSVVDCLVLVPPVILLTMLPISVAGWGVREGAMVAAFGFVGVPAASALALSILYGLVVIVTGLPGGVIWLLDADRGAPPEEARV